VSTDKLGNVAIRIQAKPGAKQNAITGTALESMSVHDAGTIILCFKKLSHIMYNFIIIF
jgi:hypothetical protein